MSRPRRPLTATLLALALTGTGAGALAGCGDKSDPGSADVVTTPAATQTVRQTTRVEVVKQLAGDGDGQATGFDPGSIYDREGPGVVTVISTGLGGAAGEDSGLGSGFVVSDDGEIATNAHVVTSGEGDGITKARSVYVRFQDGNQVPATVRGFDPFADVALLKVDTKGLDLKPLPLGSSTGLQVGAPVAAIGSPFGEEQSLSVGVISATDRSIESLTGFSTSGAIQTDAAINHGNSGGPLIDAKGQVLGINSQIRTESGDGTGVGFAVPVDAVRRSLDQLRSGGKVRYAYLGVSSRALYPQLAERFDLPTQKGVWVQQVTDDGPAADAGLHAGGDEVRFQEQRWNTDGDIIVGVNDTPVRDDDDLAQALLPFAPGTSVTVKLYRDGKRQDVKVKLGERPISSPLRG